MDQSVFKGQELDIETSVRRLSQLENFQDLSAEFHLRNHIALSEQLRRHRTIRLGDESYITDGEHGSPDWDDNSNINYITAEYIKPNRLLAGPYKTISKEQDERNARARLREHDVLIYSVGAYAGLSAVAEPHVFPANIPRSVAIVRPPSELSSHFLSIFLNSVYGAFQTRRLRAGNSQPVLALEKIEQIEVPIFNDRLQAKLTEIYQQAYRLRLNASDTVGSANQIILRSLGLADWTPPEPLSYSARSSDAFAAGRWDAQYFRPLFEEVERRLSATGAAVELGAILDINSRGRQPVYSADGVPVVNSKHVRTNKVLLNDDNRRAVKTGSPVVIEKGDVLVNGTGVGTIGRAATFLHESNALPDNHVTVLRTSRVDPIYLAVFLNSLLGQLQIERHIKGSSGQIELYPNDIAKVVLWDAPEHVQSSIRDDIMSAFNEERRANDLLEAAKRAVEIAIADGEDAAMTFLDEAEGAG